MAGHFEFTSLFGRKIKIPYEDTHAILETHYLTVFSFKSGKKFLFIPKQTYREEDFDGILRILQRTLQTKE